MLMVLEQAEAILYFQPLLLLAGDEARLAVAALAKLEVLAAALLLTVRDTQETLQAYRHRKEITAAMVVETLRRLLLAVVAVLLRLGVTAIMAPQLAALEEMEPHRQLAAAALLTLAVVVAADLALQLAAQAVPAAVALAHQQPPELMEL